VEIAEKLPSISPSFWVRFVFRFLLKRANLQKRGVRTKSKGGVGQFSAVRKKTYGKGGK